MFIKDRKVVISAAITGATMVPSLSPYLPKNPDEIIRNAVDAHKAGAAVVHIHARAENGGPHQGQGGLLLFSPRDQARSAMRSSASRPAGRTA